MRLGKDIIIIFYLSTASKDQLLNDQISVAISFMTQVSNRMRFRDIARYEDR